VSGPAVSGRVLDVPALLDAAGGFTEYMRAVIYLAEASGDVLAVPSTVRARAAAQLGTTAEFAELDWFLSVGTILEIPLAADEAAEVDQLTKAHLGDRAAAHAALIARRRGWPVITSEERVGGYRAAGVDVELLP
jgi:hypothetical protein